MIEVYMKLPATVDATTAVKTPTTSGPFTIPTGYPDIAWMATTTVVSIGSPILFASTSGVAPHSTNAPSAYTSRSFNFKVGKRMEAGAAMVVKYRAVGELVRT